MHVCLAIRDEPFWNETTGPGSIPGTPPDAKEGWKELDIVMGPASLPFPGHDGQFQREGLIRQHRIDDCRSITFTFYEYCFHRLATPRPSKRNFEEWSTLCSVSDLVTSFIFNLPATSLVPYRDCLCKLVNLHSKTSVHVRDHQSAWVGISYCHHLCPD
jgi:hypothetical protein